jgi:hypothetical protein
MQIRTAAVRGVGEVYLNNEHLRSHAICETLMHRMKDTVLEVRMQVRLPSVFMMLSPESVVRPLS